ncbi:hypothetical protein ACTVCO_09260 [Sanguibacter sp. A247]|uniref:hypothetical protein n=1 Tax=unclassified Sanguibacter TaxID=2645534 RepID=UPI003FD8E398
MTATFRAPARFGAALLVTLGLTLTTACTSGPAPGPSPTPTGTVSLAPTVNELRGPDGTPLVATTVDIATAQPAAEGTQYSVVAETPPLTEQGDPATAFGVQPDGTALLAGIPADFVAKDATLTGEATFGGYLEGTLTELTRAKALPVGASSTDDVTVWVESLTGDVANGRWRIRAVEAGGAVTTLAESKDLGVPGNVHAAIATPRPVVHDDRVYFNAAYVEQDGTSRVQVLSVPVAGGSVRVEVKGATTPVVFDGGVAVLRLGDGLTPDGAQNPLDTVGVAVLLDGRYQEIVSVGASGNPGAQGTISDLAGGGDTLSFARQGVLYVVDARAGTAVAVAAPSDTTFVGVAQCGSRLTWSALGPEAGQFVYDVDDGALWRVADAAVTGRSFCAGDLLAWDHTDNWSEKHTVTLVTRWE